MGIGTSTPTFRSAVPFLGTSQKPDLTPRFAMDSPAANTPTLPLGGDSVAFSVQNASAAKIRAEKLYNEQQRQIVSAAAANLGRLLGLPPERQALLQLAGQHYNTGKDPENNPLWTKTDALTPDEVREMQTYPLKSVNRILALSAEKRAQGKPPEAERLNQIIPIVLTHKYNYNGGGYPVQQTMRQQIPAEAQILGLVDAYYAMISARPYRPAPLPPEDAMRALWAESGRKWDPYLVQALMGMIQASPPSAFSASSASAQPPAFPV
jgi:HD-GYP domain-containing protein (c-di-GMP phosphodiesterase class II)